MTTRRELARQAELEAAHTRALSAINKAFPNRGPTTCITQQWKDNRTIHCVMCPETTYLPLLSSVDWRSLDRDENDRRIGLCSKECHQDYLDKHHLRG